MLAHGVGVRVELEGALEGLLGAVGVPLEVEPELRVGADRRGVIAVERQRPLDGVAGEQGRLAAGQAAVGHPLQQVALRQADERWRMVAVHRERLVEVLDGPRDVRLGQLTHRRSTAQVGLEGGRRGVVGARQPRRLLARRVDAEPAHHVAGDEPRQLRRALDRLLERPLEHGRADPGAQHGDPHASHPVVPRRRAADQPVDLVPRQHRIGGGGGRRRGGRERHDPDAGQQAQPLRDDFGDALGEGAVA